MNIAELISDKGVKEKEKTLLLSQWLLANPKHSDELLNFAKTAKDPAKATCIESMEFATQNTPALATKAWFAFAVNALPEKAPRVKWEAAKVIGNTAHLFQTELDEAIANLLQNAEHEGTVVRWSAAFALGKILNLNTPHTEMLLPAIEAICQREEKNSIKKIYQSAVKALKTKS